jgi:hypothetical protein
MADGEIVYIPGFIQSPYRCIWADCNDSRRHVHMTNGEVTTPDGLLLQLRDDLEGAKPS